MEQSALHWHPWLWGTVTLMVTAATLPAQAGDLAFAYADAAGKQLLAPPDIAGARQVQQALCPGNELVTVRFVKVQAADARRDTGRDSAENFPWRAGQVFRIVDNEVAENDVCLLAPPAYIRGREPLSFEPLLAREDQRDGCSEPLRQRIRASRQRPLSGCWPVATIGDDDSIVVVLFERRGKDVLAALVLDRGGRLTFADYPGDTRDESSVWRVDDDGVFDPGAFDVLFVIEGAEGVEVGVEWAGAEGSNVTLLQAAGVKFRERLTAYFYRAP